MKALTRHLPLRYQLLLANVATIISGWFIVLIVSKNYDSPYNSLFLRVFDYIAYSFSLLYYVFVFVTLLSLAGVAIFYIRKKQELWIGCLMGFIFNTVAGVLFYSIFF